MVYFLRYRQKTRFPVNFNWEISVAWVRTLHKQNFGRGKRSGFFSRNSKLRLPQTDAIKQGWVFGAWLQRIGQKEYFPLILVGGFTDACHQRPIRPQWRRQIFWHRWGGGDPTILYYITGYGLNGLLFEIQRKTRFPINFNWEISVAWVRTLHEQNFGRGKRSGFFSRNSKLRLPQTDAI